MEGQAFAVSELHRRRRRRDNPRGKGKGNKAFEEDPLIQMLRGEVLPTFHSWEAHFARAPFRETARLACSNNITSLLPIVQWGGSYIQNTLFSIQ